MERVIKTAIANGCLCVLILALYAAFDGFLHGAGARRQHPPGLGGAFINTCTLTVFYGPAAWLIGTVSGAGAGLVGLAIDGLRGRDRR